MLLWLWGVLSCKDLKSWESIYGFEVQIKFEQEKDEQIPNVLKDLQSAKLEQLYFIKKPIILHQDEKFLLTNSLTIPLDPNADAVSFELASKDGIYYHKVTIYYRRTRSLISPEAGGLQIQYTIKAIQLHTKDNKRPIFKEFVIENPVPLTKEKAKTHVTLYY